MTLHSIGTFPRFSPPNGLTRFGKDADKPPTFLTQLRKLQTDRVEILRPAQADFDASQRVLATAKSCIDRARDTVLNAIPAEPSDRELGAMLRHDDPAIRRVAVEKLEAFAKWRRNQDRFEAILQPSLNPRQSLPVIDSGLYLLTSLKPEQRRHQYLGPFLQKNYSRPVFADETQKLQFLVMVAANIGRLKDNTVKGMFFKAMLVNNPTDDVLKTVLTNMSITLKPRQRKELLAALEKTGS
jgi:hypothetical protein